MPKFWIEISYSKEINASDKDEAQRIIDNIEARSNLDGEYGPFTSLDVFTKVEEVTEE